MKIAQQKKRQFWFGVKDYERFIIYLFPNTFRKAKDIIRSFVKDLFSGMSTLILFFVPVVTSLAFMTCIGGLAAIVYSTIALLMLIIIGISMPISNLMHIIPIAFYRGLEHLRRWKGANVYICPYHHGDIWETEWKLPLKKCPKLECDKKHPLLWPSRWGVFYHKCECNTKIPAMNWLGRTKLKSFCPVCEERIKIRGFGLLPQLGFAMVGGSSSGKTSFMEAALDEMKNNEGNPGIRIGSADPELGSSDRINPIPYVWQVSDKNSNNLLYIYDPHDPEGGIYTHLRGAPGGYEFLKQVHGLLFMVDPFGLSIPGVIHRSAIDPSTIMNFVKNNMEHIHISKPGQMIDIPVAAVITKVDDAQIASHFNPEYSSDEIRKKLIDLNNTLLVHMIEHTFTRVRYFAASAVDKKGVAEPFIWLLKCCQR